MAFLSLTATQAQQRSGQKTMPVVANPLDLNPVNSQKVLDDFAREQAAKTTTTTLRRAGMTKAKKRTDAEPVKYLVAAQSHTVDYSFVYEGGDFSVWDIDVTVDGTDVKFEHLFHVEALSPEWNPYYDEVVTGVYDADAKTVTIAAPSGANGTVVATGNGSFLTVISGEVSPAGQMTSNGSVIFDVETANDGTITRMTSRYAIALPTYYGQYTYGTNAVYRQFIINLPGDDASLLVAKTSLDLGKCFVGEEISSAVRVINLGGATASYVVDVESDPEDYIVCKKPTGEIESGEMKDIEFTLVGIGLTDDVEGIGTIAYEGINAEGSFDVVLSGKIVPATDFSPVVKNGDFTFKTNIDGPWEVMTDEENVTWAKSGAKGRKMTSNLDVYFTVPEGQIGTMSWIGKYKNNPAFRYSFYNLAGWFIDDIDGQAEVALQYEGDASAEKEFGPGTHVIRFQQQAQYASNYEDDGLYIRDLNLDLVQADPDVAEVTTPVVNFGFFILEEGGGVDGDQTIVIQNRGSNKLTLKSITCDNDEFMAETSEVEEAGTLEDLVIPVFFSTTTAGTKTATFTVETSAGTFTVEAKANVYNQPDFSQIVVEGAEYITFTINPESPYIVENGVAYNVDCEKEDLVASSMDWYAVGTDLTLNIVIPEGKIGYLTWEATVWGNPIDNETYSHIYGDYAQIFVDHGNNSAQMQAFADDIENGGDASSRLFSNDEFWASFLTNEPGTHKFTFRYYHNGDGETFGRNRIEISNIRLHVVDFQEYGAELLTEGPVVFEPTYVGFNRFTTVNATLKNTGSQPLKVTGFEAEGENSPFVSMLPTYEASFNNTLDVTLVFYPGVKLDANGNVESVDETVGLYDTWFTDKVTIKTTAGDFSLDVRGMAKGSEGILLIGDFEDDAFGWDRFDQDGDQRYWDLGTSFWWYERPEYCHSGVQCIASASSDSGQALTPDNWVVSPSFTVPEGGAMLTWWAGSLHNSLCAEHYSVYIEEDFSDPSKFNGMTPVFSETLEVDPDAEYHEHQLDLSDYVGKTVRVAFRHHDCTNQYLLRIDDVFVYTMDKWDDIATSINGMPTSNDIVSRQYFNAAGQRVNRPANGVNIVRQTMKDGSVKSVKMMNK
jgi:hypothetical protein